MNWIQFGYNIEVRKYSCILSSKTASGPINQQYFSSLREMFFETNINESIPLQVRPHRPLEYIILSRSKSCKKP
jgi:hypothetical protein